MKSEDKADEREYTDERQLQKVIQVEITCHGLLNMTNYVST